MEGCPALTGVEVGTDAHHILLVPEHGAVGAVGFGRHVMVVGVRPGVPRDWHADSPLVNLALWEHAS